MAVDVKPYGSSKRKGTYAVRVYIDEEAARNVETVATAARTTVVEALNGLIAEALGHGCGYERIAAKLAALSPEGRARVEGYADGVLYDERVAISERKRQQMAALKAQREAARKAAEMAIRRTVHTVRVEGRHVATIDPGTVQAGCVGTDYVELELDQAWDGMNVHVVFSRFESETVDYDGEPIEVPEWAIARAGKVQITVVGTSENSMMTTDAEGAALVVVPGHDVD